MSTSLENAELKIKRDNIAKISDLPENLQDFFINGLEKGYNYTKSDSINTIIYGRTPLLWAAGYNRPDIAIELLKYEGIEINHIVPSDSFPGPWGRGENALAIFVHYYNETSVTHFQIIEALVKKEPLSAKNFVVPSFGINDGSNLLHLAACKNSTRLMNLFLSIGIDVNARNIVNCDEWHPKKEHDKDCFRGETVLHSAVKTCDKNTVKFLLDAKADINATNITGLTPLDRAKEDVDKSNLLDNGKERKSIKKLLVSYGAKLKADLISKEDMKEGSKLKAS